MIQTRNDLKRYLEADRLALNMKRKHPIPFWDRIWNFQRQLRFTEFYYNNRHRNIFFKFIGTLLYILWRMKVKRVGMEIPINVIDEGLCIWHGYGIVINPNARIGKNFSISAGCVVGQAKGEYPIIGDNVEMTIHSMILGGIRIADNVVIAPGACVVKSIEEQYVTMGGYQQR